jgi:hypothetical protein
VSPTPARWAGVLAVAALLLGACATGAEVGEPGLLATASGPAEPAAPLGARLDPGFHRLEVGGQDAIVLVPERPVVGLVVYAHGYGAGLDDLLDGQAFGGLAQALVAAGYAVAAGQAGGNAWGDAASVDSHALLAATARRLVGSPDVFLVAESMGGLAAAQLVSGDRIAGLRAYAGIAPLCDLSSVYDEFPDSVDAAHGGGVDEALARLSPVRLDADVPVLPWASDDDTVVPRNRNADVCAAQVAAAGGSARVVAARGEHGDPAHYDPRALLAFFAAAAT